MLHELNCVLMEQIQLMLVDTFATRSLSGIPTGVVPNASGLDTSTMQEIAREIPVGEIAFLYPSDDADPQIRYFTPQSEIESSGYATIGAFIGLLDAGTVQPGEREVKTNRGIVQIDITDDHHVWQTGLHRAIDEVSISPTMIADGLGISENGLATPELPIAAASVDAPWLIVPVSYFSDLRSITPKWPALTELCHQHDLTGIYAFTFDTLQTDTTAHARVFLPNRQREVPGARMAAGAAGVYIREMQALDGGSPDGLCFEQGYHINRPAHVSVKVARDVRVGGTGTITLNAKLSVDSPDPGDIIEA